MDTDKQAAQSFAEWYENGGMENVAMLPGEASWASLKCNGGPHAEDQPIGQVKNLRQVGDWAINSTTAIP